MKTKLYILSAGVPNLVLDVWYGDKGCTWMFDSPNPTFEEVAAKYREFKRKLEAHVPSNDSHPQAA